MDADGTLDTGFDPNANSSVHGVAMQGDGKILLAGAFTTLQPNGEPGTVVRNRMARLNNDAVSDALSVPSPSRVQWLRGGAAPEAAAVSIELSTDGGAVYVPIGSCLRIAGGWELAGLSLPPSGHIRALARIVGGYANGSSGLVETVVSFSLPDIAVFTGASTEPVDERTDNVGTHSFGSVSLGGSSPAQIFTVRNSGTENLTGLALTTTGADPGDFTLGTLGAATLAPNASTTFTVTFSPTGNGTRRAVMNIASNDGNENPFRINVSGSGPTATDADLSALALSAGTLSPAFASETTNYTASVPFGFSSLTVTPTAAQTDAAITVNATPVASGAASGSIALNVGENTITTVVTAQDGTTQETYTMLVTRAAPVAGDLDPLDATVVGTSVLAAVLQPDGKTIIAGTFTSVLGVTRANIARLNADGTLDTGFDPNTNGTVNSVAVKRDGRILLGGAFTTLQPNGAPDTTARQRIALLNADGTLDPSFDPKANGTVNCVAVQGDGRILLAGAFTTLQPNGAASPISRNRSARINADGTLDAGFVPNGANTLNCVAVQADGKILLGYALGGLTRVNPDGSPDEGFSPAPNGSVNSLAVQADGKIVLGGAFTTLQPNALASPVSRNRIARMNADGTLDASFDPNASNVIYSVVAQADGRILLGGAFTTLQPNGAFSTKARQFIARVNADGTLDTGFDPKAGATVNCVVVQAGGKILLGGSFSSLQPNGVPVAIGRNRFARLYNDAVTETLSIASASRIEWLRGGAAPEATAVSFELSTDGGNVYVPLGAGAGFPGGWELTGLGLPASGHIRALARTVAGYLSGSSVPLETMVEFSDLPIPEIAVFTGASTSPPDERSDGVGTHSFGGVRLGDSSAAQTFTIVNTGTETLQGISLSETGAHLGDFTLGALGASTLEPNESTTFTVTFIPTVAGIRDMVVWIASNDADENPFRINLSGICLPSTNADLSSLAISPGTLSPSFAAGTTSYTAGLLYARDTLTVTPATAQPNATITVNGTPVTSGGTSGSIPLNVGVNAITTVVTAQDGATQKAYTVMVTRAVPVAGDLEPLNANVVGSSVLAIAVQPDGKTIIAGLFSSVLGVARDNIARLNADGTLDLGFDPKTNSYVYSVAVQADGKILLAGVFTSLQSDGSVGPILRQRVARLNADGTLDMDFSPEADSNVYCVTEQADGKILLGGAFTTLQPNGAGATTTRNKIARVNADGSLDTGFDPKANGTIYSVAVQTDGKILLGGEFTTLQPTGAPGTTARNCIARLNADGTLDEGFDPNANSMVNTVVVQADAKILLGGFFVTLQPNGVASSTSRQRIARVHPDGSLDTSFDPKANGTIYSVAMQTDGKILLGGDFTSLQPNGAHGTTSRQRIARVHPDGSLDTGFDSKADNIVYGITVGADGKVLLGGYFTSLQPNGAPSAIARNGFARLHNDAASQVLGIAGAGQVEWLRGGSSPETLQVNFELSTNGGTVYAPLGAGMRIANGWELAGLTLPPSGQLRARARTTGGIFSGSGSIVEAAVSFGVDSDNDGLLDSWELTYWPTTTGHNPLDDSDHDGYCELLELALGLNPTLPDAGGLPAVVNEDGYLTMTITKQAGVTYEVQSAGTLLPALPDSFSASTTTVLINNGATLKVRDNFLVGSSPPRFMRVKVTAAP